MAPAPAPTIISGFTVLPVAYSSSSDSIHYLYVRRHVSSESSKRPKKGTESGKEAQLPDGRTLFIVNMPPDATEREVMLFFKFCGTVERVIFNFTGGSELQGEENDSVGEDTSDLDSGVEGEKGDGGGKQRRRKQRKQKNTKGSEEKVPRVVLLPAQNIRKLRKTGRTAHVVFLDASSLERLFSITAPSDKPRTWPMSEEPLGLSHYAAQYAALRPPMDVVKEHADSYIRVYDYELKKTRKKSKFRAGEAIVDEDGFTLVVRGGTYGRTLGGGISVASKKFQQTGVASEKGARKRRKAGEDKDGFYAFHKAERQRNALIELKKKWEEDKAKIEKLKESRRFKPY